MIYILISLVAAMLYGLASLSLHGYAGLLTAPFVDSVFWWLVGGGALLAWADGRQGLRGTLRRMLPRTVCRRLACL